MENLTSLIRKLKKVVMEAVLGKEYTEKTSYESNQAIMKEDLDYYCRILG